MELCERKCIACSLGTPPLKGEKLQELLRQLSGWEVPDQQRLNKTFKFPDFAAALRFTNRVGKLAEEQAHHPDIQLSWGKVRIELYTHKIKGLSEADFVLAAKIDTLPTD